MFFPQEDYCVPATYEILLVSHPKFVSERRAEAAAFLRALVRAIDWTIEYPADALTLFFERFPDLDDVLNRRSFETTLSLYAVGAIHADEEVWSTMQAYLVEHGLMVQEFPIEELYTDSLLPNK